MPRQIRYIKSNGLYEICFRAKDSLPFCCTEYMRAILSGIVARVQRDRKVVLHHQLFEGSHVHMLCTAKDANQCVEFYGQIQKQITDSCKRLLGVTHLTLWEERASVIEIPTLEDAIDKISYIYANPSNDDLVQSIADYPGLNSWKAFEAATGVASCSRSIHPWLQLPMIPKLPSRSVTKRQDERICEQMFAKAEIEHTLEVFPLLWVTTFRPNVSARELQRIKREILEGVRAREQANRRRRMRSGKRVMGVDKLRKQSLLKRHRSKKQGVKIQVQSKITEIRLALLAELKAISARCREVYRHWKCGDRSLSWPPGTFPPPIPPLANCLLY